MQSSKVKVEAIKGEEVRFIAGKYAGKKGWVNVAMKESGSAQKIHVLVDRSDVKKGAMVASFVYKSSITTEKSYRNATTLAAAVVQQCPDIEAKLIAVCRAFVVAGVQNSGDGFLEIVSEFMNDALKYQKNRGSKALYRMVIFSPNSSKNK